MTPLNVETALIISDDQAFANTLTARWKQEAQPPAFLVMGSDTARETPSISADLILVGPVERAALPELLRRLESASARVICMVAEAALVQELHPAHRRMVFLAQHPGWPGTVLALGREMLRRAEAELRARGHQDATRAHQRDAVLGRFMLETRHTFNNALTSVLGNAELLMMHRDRLPPQMCDQLQVIHDMTLRMHEILKRFASLEAEMRVAGRASQAETEAAVPLVR